MFLSSSFLIFKNIGNSKTYKVYTIELVNFLNIKIFKEMQKHLSEIRESLFIVGFSFGITYRTSNPL